MNKYLIKSPARGESCVFVAEDEETARHNAMVHWHGPCPGGKLYPLGRYLGEGLEVRIY